MVDHAVRKFFRDGAPIRRTDSDDGSRSRFYLGPFQERGAGSSHRGPVPIQPMSDRSPSDESITTAADFRRALNELLGEALENGFDPRGSWEYRARDGEMSVEVQIHELSD